MKLRCLIVAEATYHRYTLFPVVFDDIYRCEIRTKPLQSVWGLAGHDGWLELADSVGWGGDRAGGVGGRRQRPRAARGRR